MQPMHVPAGATIFRAGDPSVAVYVIEDGEVAITVDGGAEGLEAGRIEVVRLHAGELFGESGVLEDRVRAATATAVAATTLLVTDAETFVRAFGMDNDRALALVKLLCRRLRDTTRRAARSDQPFRPDAADGAADDVSKGAAQGAAQGVAQGAARGNAPATAPRHPAEGAEDAVIRLFPDRGRLVSEYHMAPVEVRHLPFRVSNRYGGETLPIASDRGCCIAAAGEPDLAAPHFEIVRLDGELGVRDLGSRFGTIVNGVAVTRASLERFIPLHAGANDVIAGRPNSPFRFRIQLRGA